LVKQQFTFTCPWVLASSYPPDLNSWWEAKAAVLQVSRIDKLNILTVAAEHRIPPCIPLGTKAIVNDDNARRKLSSCGIITGLKESDLYYSEFKQPTGWDPKIVIMNYQGLGLPMSWH
jgi:hypothetical protein